MKTDLMLDLEGVRERLDRTIRKLAPETGTFTVTIDCVERNGDAGLRVHFVAASSSERANAFSIEVPIVKLYEALIESSRTDDVAVIEKAFADLVNTRWAKREPGCRKCTAGIDLPIDFEVKEK